MIQVHFHRHDFQYQTELIPEKELFTQSGPFDAAFMSQSLKKNFLLCLLMNYIFVGKNSISTILNLKLFELEKLWNQIENFVGLARKFKVFCMIGELK